MKKIGVHFGAICDPIHEQLNAKEKEFKREQAIADCITRLTVIGYMRRTETDRMRKKLMQEIADKYSQLNAKEKVE